MPKPKRETVFVVRERFDGETCITLYKTKRLARAAVDALKKEYAAPLAGWKRTENGWESPNGNYSFTYQETEVKA